MSEERLAFTCGVPAATTKRVGRRSSTHAESRVEPIARVQQPERDRLAFRALLVFMFLLLVRPQDMFPFLNPLHFAEIAGTVAFVSLVAGRLSRGDSFTRMTPELLGVIAFGAMILATVPFSFWPGGTFELFTGQFLKIIVVCVVMINTLTTRQRLEQFVTLIALGATYVGMRAVIDYARGVNLVEDGRVAGAVGGLFGNPNDMALNMVTFLPLGIGLALDRGRPTMRLIGMLSVPAMVGAIIFSKSRGGTVGLIAMLIVLLFYMRRIRPSVAALVMASAILALPMLPASFTSRMASIFDAEQDPTGSRESRKTLLKEGWRVFMANPVLGIGAGQFPNYGPDARQEAWRQTHNTPLQVAAEMGIVGLALLTFLIWTGFSAARGAVLAVRRSQGRGRQATAEAPRRGPPGTMSDADWLQLNASMVVASMTGWFVAAMFASVAYYWTLYLLLGITAALRDITSDVVGSDRPRQARSTASRAA